MRSRGGVLTAVLGVALVVLLGLSVVGTSAHFTHRLEVDLDLTTGEVTVVASGLDQTFTDLLPGVERSGTFTATNASTAAIDAYLWLEPSGSGVAGYCAAEVAPYLQVALTVDATPVLDFTSACDLVNVADRSGSSAPILLVTDLPTGAQRTVTVRVRLHPAAGDDLAGLTRGGDRIVLYATQDLAPAPAPAGPVSPATGEPVMPVVAPLVLDGVDAEDAEDAVPADRCPDGPADEIRAQLGGDQTAGDPVEDIDGPVDATADDALPCDAGDALPPQDGPLEDPPAGDAVPTVAGADDTSPTDADADPPAVQP